jgi:site-specific recombinase XerD
LDQCEFHQIKDRVYGLLGFAFGDGKGMAAIIVSAEVNSRDSAGWNIITSLVLDGISSPHTRRAYSQALEEFLIWLQSQPDRSFHKATVQKYRAELELKCLAPSSVNVRLAAIRRLAVEASDNGLIPPHVAAGIIRVKGARQAGVRLGLWLTKAQATQLLSVPDPSTIKGIRDAALLAILISTGLRRHEVAALNCAHIQQREGRWLIADLIGKHGRVRSVPLPDWSVLTIERWKLVARISDGALFRSLTRHEHITERRLSPQVIFGIVKCYGAQIGLAIRPHDLRRTFAKLAHLGDSPVEQIQFSLGHASLVTTELYLGTQQDLHDAPCDHLGLRVADPDSSGVGALDL